jgi:hypothetical protein
MSQSKSKTGIKKKSTPSPPPSKTTPPAAPRKPLPDWTIVGALFILTILLRWQYLDIPLERDESIYYYIGKAALDGGRPYFDFYEMKPPGLFYSYAMLVAIFGYSALGAHLALVFVSLSNTLFTYLIAKKLAGKSVATIAAFAFVFFSLNPGASGLYLVAEHVTVLWGLPGIWLALSFPEKPNITRLFLSGVFLSMAVLVRQTAAVYGLAVVIYWLLTWLPNRREQSLKPLLWWILGGIIPLLGSVIVIWASGTFQDAKFWLYDYSHLYATSTNEDKVLMYFQVSWKLISEGYEGYFILAVIGLVALWWSRLSLAVKIFISAWTLLSALTIVPGMRFYGHYYLVAFPAMCISGAMLFYTLGTRVFGNNRMPIAMTVLGLLWGAHHVVVNRNLYINPPLRLISRIFSPGNPFPEHQLLAAELNKVLQPDDTVAMFGSDPQYFVYLNKTSPIRHVYMPFISKGQFPEALVWQKETVDRLKETRPKYVIFNSYPYAWMVRYDNNYPFTRHIMDFLAPPNYDPLMFIEADSKTKPAVVKYKVQQGAVTNDVNFIQVYKRRD